VISAGCDGYLRVTRAEDGAEIKKVELGGYTGASPAVLGGRAYVGTFENEVLAVDLEAATVLWRYRDAEREFPFLSSAAVRDDIVVVGGRDGRVHALDPKTGAVRWRFAARGKVDSSPVIAGERVYVGSAGGEIFALGLESGEAVWSFDTGAPIIASPSVASGRVLIGTEEGRLYCFGKK
jgi:outer membrane protein assembly factor BamB